MYINVSHINSLSTKLYVQYINEPIILAWNVRRGEIMSFQLRTILLKSVLVLCICTVVITISLEHTLREDNQFDTGCQLFSIE